MGSDEETSMVGEPSDEPVGVVGLDLEMLGATWSANRRLSSSSSQTMVPKSRPETPRSGAAALPS